MYFKFFSSLRLRFALLVVIGAWVICGLSEASERSKAADSNRSNKKDSANGRISSKRQGLHLGPSPEPLHFQHAAVSSDNHLCSEMGKSMLVRGGSAVDCAITVQLCIEVVNSHSTGIGGGGFMIIYDQQTGNSTSIDFRETLPLKYKNGKEKKKKQGEVIMVPGVLRGLEKAHKKFGKLKWSELFQPAIELAENGFKVSVALRRALHSVKPHMHRHDGLMELFAPNGIFLTDGDIMKRPTLAKTFRKIAKGGADVFYKGKMAKQIVKDIKDAGGFITLKDLRKYKAIARKPLKTTIKSLEMLSLPPPGSGALVSLALKIMSGFNWTKDDIDNANENPLTYHNIIEALKFAYAPNTFLGDPKFSRHNKDVVEYMLSDKVAENMRSRIDNKSHPIDYYGPHSTAEPEDKRGTTHISVLGPNGDAVSLTSTINGYFGSKLRSTKLGIIYNNELLDFSEFWPSVYKLKKDKKIPGKRPMSKASPTIFVNQNGTVKGVFGAAGGHFIPTALSMTIANWLFFGDDIKQAITRPRLHCQLFPPTVVHEKAFPAYVIPMLHHYKHLHVTSSTYDVSGQENASMGIVQAIVKDDYGRISAEADVRKGGIPAGY